jgi:hypothetical protein
MPTIGDITSLIDSLKRRFADAPLQTAGDVAGGMVRSIPTAIGDVATLAQRGMMPGVETPDYGALVRSGLDKVPGLADQGDVGMKLGELLGPPAKLLGKAALAAAPLAVKLARDVPYTGMRGLPKSAVGPHEPARKAAADYMESTGRDYSPPTTYVNVDAARAKRIADAYEEMPHAPNDPKVKASYDAMIKETMDQWEHVKKSGLKVDFIEGKDPYTKPSDVLRDIKDNNHMWVYPTDAGFGGSASKHIDVSGNPLLQPAGEINGRPVVANDIFRIVHDYFGHAKEGVGFRANGEENAWRSHAAMYSPEALPAMTAETRGQNSWVNFGPHAEANKTANAAETQYAPQKTGLLPDEFNVPHDASTHYPTTMPGEPKVDAKSGKEFTSKQLSDDALAVQLARKAAQKDIDAGNYTPMFDVEQRFHADPANYPLQGNTLTDAMPKKAATVDQWKEMFSTPEVRKSLGDAYTKGNADPRARDWYGMGQLENAFTKELGPEEGRAMFKQRFADAMAATTGGANPTDNLMMAAYGNYQKAAGQPIPTSAVDMPFPIGGRYVTGNMGMYDKVINDGVGLSAADQPKRFNFSANFQGHTDRKTIDEQMMTAFDPSGKMTAPPGNSYGVLENILNGVLKKKGAGPMENGQDVMWAALKGVEGKPMMEHVNEMIERTARVTGKSPEEVLQGFIRSNMPMYGLAGVTAGVPLSVLMGGEQGGGS